MRIMKFYPKRHHYFGVEQKIGSRSMQSSMEDLRHELQDEHSNSQVYNFREVKLVSML